MTSDKIKKALLMSSTLPLGSAGTSSQWMMGSAAHNHDHEDDDESCDNTNPRGGCGCC